jgi:hypothetical protein
MHKNFFGRSHLRLQVALAGVVVAIALAGCTSAPIVNVDNAAVTTASGKQLSNEQVRNAIVRAGSSLGWQMKDEGPNKLVGTLQLRSHTAVIEIPYSSNAYSINYRSSVNLSEGGGKIHKNYNGWIQNLTRGINAQLSAS